MTKRERPPVHPGGILLREFMEPLGLTPAQAAERCGLPEETISGLIQEKLSVDETLAEKLETGFGFSAGAWLNLQKRFEAEMARF